MSRNKIPKEHLRKPRAVPFSDVEWDRICQAAQQLHLRPSNFIQQTIFAKIDKILPHSSQKSAKK